MRFPRNFFLQLRVQGRDDQMPIRFLQRIMPCTIIATLGALSSSSSDIAGGT